METLAMKFTLPALPYASDALAARAMKKETLELHHGKHHQAYVTALNGLVEKNDALKNKSLEELVKISHGDKALTSVFNNAGQHWNHSFFWPCLSPSGGTMPAALEKKITTDFGSVEKFKSMFKEAAVSEFGSGWAWLLPPGGGKLKGKKKFNGAEPLGNRRR